MGMFAAGRGKVTHLDKALRLFLETSHQFGEGKATFIAPLLRKAAKIADRLKMNPPHGGGQLQGLPHHGADGISVHPSHKGRDEDDAETCLFAILDGCKFLVQECSPSQRAIDLIIGPVELQEDRRKT
jgi:hypothetical protein